MQRQNATLLIAIGAAALLISYAANAQQAGTTPPATVGTAAAGNSVTLPTIEVVATTPVIGTGLDIADVPAAVSSVNANDIERTASQNVVDTLVARVPSVSINSETGNDFEPDVQFRGFVATPLSGAPEGLAVYQNGVRINEAFGDNVHWDFIPTIAINSMDIISNNPIFGLNALGGAVNVQMKNGFTYQGLSTDFRAGSFGRVQNSTEWGQQFGAYSTYAAIEVAHENGWRQFSPSTIRRAYGDIGYRTDQSEFHVNVGAANDLFGAAGTTPLALVQQNYGQAFTTPQTDHDEMGMVSLKGNVKATDTLTLAGTLYYRAFDQHHADGNPTDAQACDADPTLLCFNDGASPANGTNGQQLANPFGPNDTYGEIDYNSTRTNGYGGTLQATDTDKLFGMNNNLAVGASLDAARSTFNASAELGTIQPNFVVDPIGIFLGASGNPISDGPVQLVARNTYVGAYVLDTLDVTSRFSITGGARFNSAQINLNDQLNPAGSANSLTGTHNYTHFNPVVGGTFKVTPDLTAYVGYSQANRAPTPLELGCSNPLMPCIIDSFLVSDPNLKQVTSQTLEAGFRGKLDFGAPSSQFDWKLGLYRTDNSNDILNIPSPLNNGFGYFANVGDTRRQGVEAEVDYHTSNWQLYASYAYVDATYRSALTLAAPAGDPFADANGNIYVVPGDHISSIPKQRIKFGADYNVTGNWKIGGDVQIVGSQYFGGDESNQNPQLPGYATVNLHSSYQVTKNIQVYGLIDNLFNKHYYTYGTNFDNSSYQGNPSFPELANATNFEAVTPGMPFAAYAGVKITY